MSKKNQGSDSKDKEEEVDKSEEEEDTESDESEEEEEEESDEDDSEEEDSEESDKDDEEEESDDEDSEDDDDSSSSKDEDELDLDAELEKENDASGKKDTEKGKEAFKKREKKRQGGGTITEERLQEILAADRKERQQDEALRLARGMAGSDKEAELIVAKWANRTFPKNLTLEDQISEAYAITHRKKLLGERNEALRALRGKQGIKKDGSGTHREAAKNGSEPKLPAADAQAIAAAGFKWNLKSRQFEKKLKNGDMLIRDTKTKQVKLVRKSR